MPLYCFKCDDCNINYEFNIAFSYIKTNPETWNKHDCDDCKKQLRRAYELEEKHFLSPADVLKPKPLSTHAEDHQRKREAEKAVAIYNEGWRSKSEQLEAVEIAKEHEKSMGKTPGSLSTGVRAPKTKEEKEAVRVRDMKKKDEQVKLRRKSLK